MDIHVEHIDFSYPDKPVLRDVNCTFERGKFHAVLGPNGSGKTTLLDIVSGFLVPDKGRVSLGNTALNAYSKRHLARTIALVSQNYGINFPFSVSQVVLMGRHPYIDRFSRPAKADFAMVDKVIQKTGIYDLRHRQITQLSGGEKQRCVFARALAQDTPVLLLDEAFSNMDIHHTLHLLTLLKQEVEDRQKTIIAVLHDLNLAAAWADTLVFVKAGKVAAQGNTDTVFTPENILEVFNVETRIEYNEFTRTRQAFFKAS